MSDPLDKNGLLQSLAQAALAAIGGLIGALLRREVSTVRDSILGSLGAGFVGLLVAKFCHGAGVSEDTTFVCVGVAGWLGATNTIEILQQLLENSPIPFSKKTSKRIDEEEDKKE